MVLHRCSPVSKNKYLNSGLTQPGWIQFQQLFWKTLDSEFSSELIHAWIELLASWLMDQNCKLANQAKQLASAEEFGSSQEYAEAMFISLYGDPEEEEQRIVRRESKEKSKVGLLGVIWEFIQMEYFLYFYRYKDGLRKKRNVSASVAGLISTTDFQLAQSIHIDTKGNEDTIGYDDVLADEEEPRYDAYLADIAYFFPVIDFTFPFDGSFHFLQTQYSVYDLWYRHANTTNQQAEPVQAPPPVNDNNTNRRRRPFYV
ncbi:uncharacterized protein LOC111698272 isoform X2 [Eurytemora carolleeae]|uniref:uncharacterized protein LOC111698272 isoform X2 n=1 Tax=Eurytemora carolleeae TaxID=1294199 RepID=UPI000C77050A|nr:uncharacterized protein LOC111698272 isoform X2 [Eurytemora carolleeae]|eukprot:XP_023324326.1 uncharacterized protein LOC111698272 isoform X2 [Eurytemora affinis]